MGNFETFQISDEWGDHRFNAELIGEGDFSAWDMDDEVSEEYTADDKNAVLAAFDLFVPDFDSTDVWVREITSYSGTTCDGRFLGYRDLIVFSGAKAFHLLRVASHFGQG